VEEVREDGKLDVLDDSMAAQVEEDDLQPTKEAPKSARGRRLLGAAELEAGFRHEGGSEAAEDAPAQEAARTPDPVARKKKPVLTPSAQTFFI
jgi:hypothetical protein